MKFSEISKSGKKASLMKRCLLASGAILALASVSPAKAQSTIYPPGSTPLVASANGTTAAVAATLTPPSANTVYLCGFSIRALATAATNGLATVTGITGGTMSFTQWVAPLASGIGVAEIQIFNPCLPGIYNTPVVVNSIAAGAGGVNTVTTWGYSR